MDASFWLLYRQRNLRKPSLTMSHSLCGGVIWFGKTKKDRDFTSQVDNHLFFYHVENTIDIP